MHLKQIKTSKDGRLNAQLDVIVWDNEMQHIKVVQKSGKLFQCILDNDESILWFCVQDSNRHWTIYDVMSGYQCCWTTSLGKAREMMSDPDFIKKVNQARAARDKIQRSRYADWPNLSDHFMNRQYWLLEEYL